MLKSGSLNLLEPSGPVKACNGIALPLPFMYCLCVNVYCHRVATQLQLINIPYHINNSECVTWHPHSQNENFWHYFRNVRMMLHPWVYVLYTLEILPYSSGFREIQNLILNINLNCKVMKAGKMNKELCTMSNIKLLREWMSKFC